MKCLKHRWIKHKLFNISYLLFSSRWSALEISQHILAECVLTECELVCFRALQLNTFLEIFSFDLFQNIPFDQWARLYQGEMILITLINNTKFTLWTVARTMKNEVVVWENLFKIFHQALDIRIIEMRWCENIFLVFSARFHGRKNSLWITCPRLKMFQPHVLS
jgi:hypothetical protein